MVRKGCVWGWLIGVLAILVVFRLMLPSRASGRRWRGE